jgi:hypothetical protein
MADGSAWTMTEAEPARLVRGHGELTGLAVPAFAPDVS